MSDARELGEELKQRLALMGHWVGLFDSDPDLDDYDPKYGAHLQAVGPTRTVIVDLPHMATNGLCCRGVWTDDDGLHEQLLGHHQVVDFIATHAV